MMIQNTLCGFIILSGVLYIIINKIYFKGNNLLCSHMEKSINTISTCEILIYKINS